MKITNDVNNNTDFLSSSNKGDENTSLLGSLFSINFDSNEINSNDISDESEFTFNKDEVKIIDYLQKILPTFNISKLDTMDFISIKNEIQLNQNIEYEIKNKILSFLESGKNYSQNILVKIPENDKFKVLTNNKMLDNNSNPKFKAKTVDVSLPIMKTTMEPIDKNKQKIFKEKIINKNANELINSEDELNNQQTTNSNNKKVNFVKRINKNEHPNKLYQSSHSNSFKSSKKIVSTSLADPKSLNNTDLNYINNQINDDLKKNKINDDLKNNKINEIKLNDKLSNIQSLFEAGSKGNQFSQQNSNPLTSSGFNSVLEGLLETLDLSQKGWTSKLVSRIENALEKGGEEIEFNLKPKKLGKLKVSISLKNGTGNVKIITENNFVASALTQNENHLQKLFNDQGFDLEFLAHEHSQNFGSQNNFKKDSKNNNQNKFLESNDGLEETNSKNSLDDNISSRHIINVIA